jgi:hypothetical protein
VTASAGLLALGAVVSVASLYFGGDGNKAHRAAAGSTTPVSVPAAGTKSVSAKSVSTTSLPTTGSPATPGSSGRSTRGAHSVGGTISQTSNGSPGEVAPATNTEAIDPKAATSPAVDLPVPAGFGPLLRHVWVAADPGDVGLSAIDVQSTLAGSVFFATQPAISNYWAISSFVASARALSTASTTVGKARLAEFHTVAVFNKLPGQGWTYIGGAAKCPASVPPPVFKAWGICGSGPGP